MIKSNIDSKKTIFTLELTTWEKRLLSLSPASYAMVSAALIGAAINLLTGLVFQPQAANNIIILSIFLAFLAAFCFCVLSIQLQELREATSNKDKVTAENDFRVKLNVKSKIFRVLFYFGFLFIIAIIVIIILKIKSG